MPLTATRLDRGTTAPSLDRLRERYDASAHHWQDNLARLGQLHDYQLLFNSRMVNSHLQHLDATSKILDCGIGTGAFSLALTESIHYPVHVSGVDISYPMLTEAYRLLEYHSTSLDLRQGDVNRLPYADNTFDAVIYAHVLEHMANPVATLREMVRVLKPGAPLIGSVTRRGLGQMVMCSDPQN